MRTTAEWLASIGLSEYAQRFTENGIDLSTVRDLTEQDLKVAGASRFRDGFGRHGDYGRI